MDKIGKKLNKGRLQLLRFYQYTNIKFNNKNSNHFTQYKLQQITYNQVKKQSSSDICKLQYFTFSHLLTNNYFHILSHPNCISSISNRQNYQISNNTKMHQQKSLRLCKYYLSGACHFGSNCRFSHDLINCFLIRHAESEFNQKLQHSQLSFSVLPEFQFSREMVDCGITEEGIKQIVNMDLQLLCNNNSKIHIDGIFVSPLNRSLQTTQHLLAIHKIKVKEVIVLANLTEILSKICDMMGQPQKTINKYPQFNFNYFKQYIKEKEQCWQDELVQDNYQYLINKNQSNALRYLTVLNTIFPTPLQSSQHCYQRSMKVISEIKQICLNHCFRTVIVVSHNRILKHISGKDIYGKVDALGNCQIRYVCI